MDLYIKITSGTRTGDVFRIQPSITLGRSKADINLKDSKASSVHGRIVEENGALFYLDLNSTNGTTIAGVETKKIKLIPGLVLTIGSTNIEVATEFEVKKSPSKNLSEWREILFNFIQKQNFDQATAEVLPFKECVVLKIKSGIQAGTSWILGYGPRQLGPKSSDLCLLDETLDDFCLKIHQVENEIVIESINQKLFIANDQKINTTTLKDRLNIQVGNTFLELGFLKNEIEYETVSKADGHI